MARPSPPSDMRINTVTEAGTPIVTRSVDGTVTCSAVIDDPDAGQDVRLVVRYSHDSKFGNYYTKTSGWQSQGTRAQITMDRLSKNTQWYVRAYTQDHAGNYSASYNAGSFYTDRYPLGATLVTPVENASFVAGTSITFDWDHVDPDGGNQSAWMLAYRVAGDLLRPPGAWAYASGTGTATTASLAGSNFKGSTTYEWCVRTRDDVAQWGPYGLIQTFSIIGANQPPLLTSPGRGVAVRVDEDQTFLWRFRDPISTSTQGNADIQYRVAGTSTWTLLAGSAHTASSWFFPLGTFTEGYQYEWQVRTYRALGTDAQSDWSDSSYFNAILAPGSASAEPIPDAESISGSLGVGVTRVFVFDRGGKIARGEITKATSVEWNRVRDDVSSATVNVTGWDTDTEVLLAMLRTWMYELVIYRDDERVWEGPITGLTYTPTNVTIVAYDVMAYVQRRILRQGYNDSYRLVAGVQQGLLTITERASVILENSLAFMDPNVLPYLTVLSDGNDAHQSRVVPDYTKTAWQEIDDMASNAGLDYTVAGRRIILWDTHMPVGLLPEMRDEDFSEPLTVSEYGMQLANYTAVTDGQGTWGATFPAGLDSTNWYQSYGPVEQLASSFGDDTGAVSDTASVAATVSDLVTQAKRNINHRWPAPLVARVPDNASVNPTCNVTINQLIPGVWIPLRAEKTVRKFQQMQKLDSMTFTADASGEKISVVMSPAPQGQEDPDSTATPESGDSE